MSFVIGRGAALEDGAVGRLGTYRALDGSAGADLYLDLDGPHAMLIVGKRGYGKSYTMGVVAEALARGHGVAPVVIDPMGVFDTLAVERTNDCGVVERTNDCGIVGVSAGVGASVSESGGGSTRRSESERKSRNEDATTETTIPAEICTEPTISPTALDPRSWCALLGLSPESGAGSLLWQAAQEGRTLEEMRRQLESSDAPAVDKRAATNHLRLADSWNVFDADGLSAADLGRSAVTVIDVSGLDAAPMNAVCRGIAESLYRARIDETISRLPWLLIDEAHTFFDGVAQPALETLLTRGRAPGVSLVLATQRPSAIPPVGISQSDILLSHRLTAQADLEALAHAQPTYMNGSLADADRLPEAPGEVMVIDDATETIHAAQIRRRETPHGGESPRASEVDPDGL